MNEDLPLNLLKLVNPLEKITEIFDRPITQLLDDGGRLAVDSSADWTFIFSVLARSARSASARATSSSSSRLSTGTRGGGGGADKPRESLSSRIKEKAAPT